MEFLKYGLIFVKCMIGARYSSLKFNLTDKNDKIEKGLKHIRQTR